MKTLYTRGDLNAFSFGESLPGEPPYTRGAYASMYTEHPWTIRQYAGFSTAEESNAFYKTSLAGGQKGLSVAFDLPTHRGYDSDHPRVVGDVGKAGVAIDSVEDMKRLFAGIPLSEVSVSMTMNGAVLPVLAAYIVAATESGAPLAALSGTIQNDILKEYMVRNTYIYPPLPSMEIVADIIEFCSQKMPRYNSMSISGYHIGEAGGEPVHELAYTLADGLEYVRLALARGLGIDEFAPRLSFFFGIGMNFLTEVAKLRAARKLWHDLLLPFAPKNKKSLALRTHTQTSGYSLTAQDPYNNIVRTTIEAMAAVLGGTQSLHTNSFDEALSLPSDFAAAIARNTQLIIAHETDITKSVDPFGGSYLMESLTDSLLKDAKALIAEVETTGGMTKAILAGIPKRRIEEAAARKQSRLDRGEDIVVGVNRFQGQATSKEPDIRAIDNQRVREAQVAQLKALKATRDPHKVEEMLLVLEKIARKEISGNLLEASINAMAARATLGEVSSALEKVWGRYEASISVSAGVYRQGFDPMTARTLIERTKAFENRYGRRPRILIAKLGQDGHDRGARVIASGLLDFGFDVDLGPLFQTPYEVAKEAVENDVHIVGISSQTSGHETLVPLLVSELKNLGVSDMLLVLGGIIPKEDHQKLFDDGVGAIFGPGEAIHAIAKRLLDLLEEHMAKGAMG